MRLISTVTVYLVVEYEDQKYSIDYNLADDLNII